MVLCKRMKRVNTIIGINRFVSQFLFLFCEEFELCNLNTKFNSPCICVDFTNIFFFFFVQLIAQVLKNETTMKRFTMLRSYLLRFQLQMLGIFYWAPIHWRHRCLLCTDEMWGSKADKLRHHGNYSTVSITHNLAEESHCSIQWFYCPYQRNLFYFYMAHNKLNMIDVW